MMYGTGANVFRIYGGALARLGSQFDVDCALASDVAWRHLPHVYFRPCRRAEPYSKCVAWGGSYSRFRGRGLSCQSKFDPRRCEVLRSIGVTTTGYTGAFGLLVVACI